MSEGRSRPGRLVVVLGTGTGVGKTWLTAGLVSELRTRGVPVAARKPVQSFDPNDPSPTDAEVLAEAAGEDLGAVCPRQRWYELGMAPPLAAAALGRPSLTVAELVAETRWPPRTEVGVVETAGGPLSPIAADGDSLALAAAYQPDLAVLVADAGLGAINAVRLSMTALAGLGCPTIVFLNRFDPSDPVHQSNHSCLESDGCDLVNTAQELLHRIKLSLSL